MSAPAEPTEVPPPAIQVLIAIHPSFDIVDFAGPLDVLFNARHDPKVYGTEAFKITWASATEYTASFQGAVIRRQIDYEDAQADLEDYDVLVVLGGPVDGPMDEIIKANEEPIPLIKAFGELQQKDPSKERTLLSICTGSLFLAKAGVLQGLAATTHPDFITRLELLCQQAAQVGDLAQTDVMLERYVVNNARFDLGDDEDENPFIFRKRPDGRRKSNARKGSNAWREGKRRASMVRRANMRLGGLRLITSGGITAGLDATLYLVAAMVSHESAIECARILQYEWRKGVTVDGIDV
ncbi:ThiJ/PfpI family protein [Phyllosticta capitalensis]|uniref:class I glutamine amidotransferase-like protein n=1 Tax=Phyllosticta capitalensis TaxID=121624 RepID=UPI00313242C3